ncbi:hypothetical protein ITI46_15495 [Streptomyces oryzae]|uniref:2Fe-2S ferredoxin-type domain-containing protein n=1 Tax=Streptomyces oryzae TaxID=1434886 RepID=A0ABS3XCG3_9ACTN|nr:hypothetical protein [Streptomyces oryzae]
MPVPEPGAAEQPFEGAPGSPGAGYAFPGAPTADPTPAPSEEPWHPEPQPGAEAGIVAGQPPAPPAGPESSQADSEVTSLAAAAPAPQPAAPQPDAGSPASGEISEPAESATPAETADGIEQSEQPADAAESAPETIPEPRTTEETSEDGTDIAAAEAGPEADDEAAALPEAVDTEDEHPHVSYVLRVNGVDRPVASAWIGESLLYVLRERLGLAGAKDGCSQGECGACSVQVDGRLVAACLVPAATAAGSEVRTVEGLSADGTPSDVQCALAESGSVQCGFCVPGLAMTVHDLLEGNHAPTELETRKAISGNLCRCSGYRGVLDAVRTVVEQRAAQAEREAAEAEAQAIDQQQGGGYVPGAYDEGAAYGGVPYEPGGGYGYDPAYPNGTYGGES